MKLLYRSVNGLLHQANKFGTWPVAFDVNDWDLPNGNVSKAISANGIRFSINATTTFPGIVRNNVVGSRSEVFIFARGKGAGGSPRLGVVGHIGTNFAPANADAIALQIPSGFKSDAQFLEYNAGVATTLDILANQQGSNATAYNFWLHLNGTAGAGLDSLTNRAWAGTAGTRNSGQTGIWITSASVAVDFYSFYVSTGRYLTVDSLTTGDVVEIRNLAGAVAATATATGASLTIDMVGLDCVGNDKVVIVRSATDIAMYQIGPTDISIVGGDTYSLDETVDAVPNAYSDMRRYKEYDGSLYFGAIDTAGNVKVCEYDPDANTTSTYTLATMTADSHLTPDILVDSDGYIWAFFSKHGAETKVYYYKSTNPGDITAWGTQQTITGWSGNVTYPYVFQNSDGRIVVICRLATENNGYWAAGWTDDGGSNWSTHAFIGQMDWMYVIPRQHTTNRDEMSLLIGDHPTYGLVHDLYMCSADLDTGNITVPGDATVLGNFYSGAIMDPRDAIQVFAATGSAYGYPDDIDEWGEVAFTVWDPDDPATTGSYKYLKVESVGTVGPLRTLTAAGDPILNDATGIQWGGTEFAGHGIIYVSREEDGEWPLEAWYTVDGGVSWNTPTVLNADPDDGVLYRVFPITSGSANIVTPFVVYVRAKGYDTATFNLCSDMIIAEGFIPPAGGNFWPVIMRMLDQQRS